MSELKVYSDSYEIAHSIGSGLGFFGNGGFGYSIAVGNWNDKTYITDASGVQEGEEVNNLEYVDSTGCYFGGSGEYQVLTEIPNDKATLNLSFRHDTSVDVQNAEFRCYDGTNVDNSPSGIEVRAFEIIHPSSTYIDNGSGDVSWVALSGSTQTLDLADSPASGGFAAFSGAEISDIQHDWFVGVSISPQSIGSKTAKLYFNLEYL